MRFWDSSALVPLLVTQPQSGQSLLWLNEDPDVVIWVLTPVEVTSALARLSREGALPIASERQAKQSAAQLFGAVFEVTEVGVTRPVAQRLLWTHPLRAADAMQLAAAILWAATPGPEHTFLTYDQQLARAAEREGFTVPGVVTPTSLG